MTPPRFDSESNDLQRPDIWPGPSTLIHINALKLIVVAGNESADSSEATATPFAPVLGDAWINELHYDNSGADIDEGVEIAGSAGLDLITAFDGSSYNAIVSEHPSLKPLDTFGHEHVLALLIGNTRALWPAL